MTGRRVLVGVFGVGLLLWLVAYLVLQAAPFGAPATGERLARIESHPRFQGGAFVNEAKLWSSWAIVGPSHRVYYSGDTGYSQHFKEIGDKLGPFDLTLIKIGAYGPGQAWLDVHMEPEPAMQAHLEVKGKTLLPVHWGTFNLANHDWDEPIRRAVAVARRLDIDLLTPRVGEWVELPATRPTQAWWDHE